METRLAGQSSEIDAISRLVLKTGRLLLVSGADAEYVRRRTTLLVSRLGVDAELFISGERILLTVDAGTSYRTRIGRQIVTMGINTGLFDDVDAVIDSILTGEIDVTQAAGRLESVEKSPPLRSAWLVIPTVAATTAALCRLFGADCPVVLAAFLGGILSIIVRRFLAARSVNPIAASFVTAFLSAMAAALLLRLSPGAQPALALVAAGMILVPGVPLINGVADVAGGHPGIGLSRLTTGLVTVVTVGFALFLAAYVSAEPLPVFLETQPLPVWQDIIFSAVAALGFSLLFNSPARAVLACVVCGTISHGLRTELTSQGLDLATATLLCSMIAGLIAHAASRQLSLPWPTFAFPGTVAMIPGSYVFRAGVGGLEIMTKGSATPPGILAETASLAITAMVLTACVGIGLLVASSFSASLDRP